MTTHDFVTLMMGVQLGALITFAAVILSDTIEARRATRTAAARLRDTLKHESTRNWRDVLTEQVKA